MELDPEVDDVATSIKAHGMLLTDTAAVSSCKIQVCNAAGAEFRSSLPMSWAGAPRCLELHDPVVSRPATVSVKGIGGGEVFLLSPGDDTGEVVKGVGAGLLLSPSVG